MARRITLRATATPSGENRANSPKTPASILASVVGLLRADDDARLPQQGPLRRSRRSRADGRSLIFDVIKDLDVCYSDIQFLWLGRGIDQHLFPFVTGGITPDGFLTGGTVEYPVLSGLLMWLGGIGSHTDAAVPAALGADPGAVRAAHRVDARPARGTRSRCCGRRLRRWCCTRSTTGSYPSSRPPSARSSVMTSSAIRCAPARFSPPSCSRSGSASSSIRDCSCCRLRRTSSPRAGTGKRYDVPGRRCGRGRGRHRGLVNLPFALTHYDGWRASFTFQEQRKADLTTNSHLVLGAAAVLRIRVRELHADYNHS